MDVGIVLGDITKDRRPFGVGIPHDSDGAEQWHAFGECPYVHSKQRRPASNSSTAPH